MVLYCIKYDNAAVADSNTEVYHQSRKNTGTNRREPEKACKTKQATGKTISYAGSTEKGTGCKEQRQ